MKCQQLCCSDSETGNHHQILQNLTTKTTSCLVRFVHAEQFKICPMHQLLSPSSRAPCDPCCHCPQAGSNFHSLELLTASAGLCCRHPADCILLTHKSAKPTICSTLAPKMARDCAAIPPKLHHHWTRNPRSGRRRQTRKTLRCQTRETTDNRPRTVITRETPE